MKGREKCTACACKSSIALMPYACKVSDTEHRVTVEV